MAAISLEQRDLEDTQLRLGRWFTKQLGDEATVSDLRAANRAAGWSSEVLALTVETPGSSREFVIRIPPSGGGVFPEHDLEGQVRTQELLRRYDVATPSPIYFEPDPDWIGSKFLVMPRIVGHTPSDTSYATRGWLHDSGIAIQQRVHDSFLETLHRVHTVPVAEAPWLERRDGVGNGPELVWWREYLAWASDNQVPDLMRDAFAWLERHQPEESGPLSICWGDARLSNTISDDSGQIVGVLDWEQACICPAEADLGWWLATRRQTSEVHGVTVDPELPGFDSREVVIARYAEMLGRPLVALDWYEMFSMIRMGCCILRIQVLLRSIGQAEHGFVQAPVLPRWVVDTVRG
ncbi:aminoglycoside phosphotransferase [Mycolicibacterium rhodesiae JS60]|nr:aminoglycoside phosphotransferase [Mycolicibacterium rhodesiae JS60]